MEVADVIAAVGEKRDDLVHLEPLRLEHLGQPAFGFGVVARHKAKAFRVSRTGHALADDQLEPAGFAVVAVASMDVAAVNADRERAIWPRQRIPVALAALNEERLLIAELTFKPLGHLLRVPIDRGSVRLEWQHLGEHVNSYPKGQECRPLGFQVASLWCRPFHQALRQPAAAAWAVGWLTGTAPEAWAL